MKSNNILINTTPQKVSDSQRNEDQHRFAWHCHGVGNRPRGWLNRNYTAQSIPANSGLVAIKCRQEVEEDWKQLLLRSFTNSSHEFYTAEDEYNFYQIKLFHKKCLGSYEINLNGEVVEEQIVSEINYKVVAEFLKDNALVSIEVEEYMTRQLQDKSDAETGPRTRSPKYNSLLTQKVHLDKIGSLSLFEDEEYQSLVDQLPNGAKCIEIKNKLCKGSGPLEIEVGNFSQAQMLTKQVLVPFLVQVEVYNNEEDLFYTAYTLNFATKLSLAKLTRYKRTQKIFTDLCSALAHQDSKAILDSKAWLEAYNKKNERYFKYWNGIKNLTEDPASIGSISLTASSEEFNNEIESQQLLPSILKNKIINSSEYSSFKKIKERYDAVSKEKDNLNQKIDSSSRELSYLNNRKSDVEKQLETLKLDCAKEELAKSELEKKLQGVESGSSILKNAFEEAEISITETIKRQLSSVDKSDQIEKAKDLINKLRLSGIKITKIQYLNENGEKLTCPRQIEQAFKNSLIENAEPKVRLHSVSFVTDKPVVIRVDAGSLGEGCPKVVGGPYAITVTSNRLDIKLASLNSCFGISKINRGHKVWVHPHTPCYAFMSSDTLTHEHFNTRNACLGEAAPSIWAAFNDNNPVHAVFAAMVWVTNANSSDEWGRHWRKFPKLKDVQLEHDNEEEELQENIASEKYEPCIDEEAEENNEALDQEFEDTFDEEPVDRLEANDGTYTAGRAGYRPYR